MVWNGIALEVKSIHDVPKATWFPCCGFFYFFYHYVMKNMSNDMNINSLKHFMGLLMARVPEETGSCFSEFWILICFGVGMWEEGTGWGRKRVVVSWERTFCFICWELLLKLNIMFGFKRDCMNILSERLLRVLLVRMDKEPKAAPHTHSF